MNKNSSQSSKLTEEQQIEHWIEHGTCPFRTRVHNYTQILDISTGERFRKNQALNIIGVVIKYQDPNEVGSGGDLKSSIVIVDPSQNWFNNGLVVNMFAPRGRYEELPPIDAIGGTILLRRVKYQIYRDGPSPTGYKRDFQWSYYCPKTNRIYDSSKNLTDKTERSRLKLLARWYLEKEKRENPNDIGDKIKGDDPEVCVGGKKNGEDSLRDGGGDDDQSIEGGGGNSSKSGGKGRQSLGAKKKLIKIEEVQFNQFFDCIVEVIKIYDISNPELYVTDYTSNPLILNRESQNTSWQGPYGRKVLQITLFDEHVDRFNDIGAKEGDFIKLLNVRGRENGVGQLEAQMNGDKYRPKPCIDILDENHPSVKELKIRKETERIEDEGREGRRPVDEQASIPSAPTITKHNHQHPMTLAEILETNDPICKYRTRCRVIDYRPRRMEEWVVAFCKMCRHEYPIRMPCCPTCADSNQEQTELNFKFYFLVEDERPTTDENGQRNEIQLIVEGEDANIFVHPLLPTDLASNPTDLYNLRTRLRRILGNLDYLKDGYLPLTQESDIKYGEAFDVSLIGWFDDAPAKKGEKKKRRFRIMDTTLGQMAESSQAVRHRKNQS